MNREAAVALTELLVDEAVQLHGDGEPFFDFIDHAVASAGYFDYLRDRILGVRPDAIATSGKFGWAFSAYAHNLNVLPKVLNFPGNLRHDALNDPNIDPNFKGMRFMFIDNSIYKARTLDQIEAYLNRWGATLVFTHVIYDGSRPSADGFSHGWTRHRAYDYLYRWHERGFRP